jgi:hypothetical protein
MADMTREELSAMTDQELLAYEREHHGDLYMTLAKAQGMQRVALQFSPLTLALCPLSANWPQRPGGWCARRSRVACGSWSHTN